MLWWIIGCALGGALAGAIGVAVWAARGDWYEVQNHG